MVVGLDNGPAQRPVVQVGRPVAGQQLVRPGQIRVPQQRADGQRVAARGKEQFAARGVGPQFGQVGLLELAEVRVDPEPVAGDADGRLEV
jgi:hypothetical protein